MGGFEPRRLSASQAGRRVAAPSATLVARGSDDGRAGWLARALRACVAACGLAAGSASGFSLIGIDPDLKSHPLQSSEFGRLDIRAGWVDGAPDRMVFDVRNPLSAPVHCASVQIDLRDRGRVVRSLEPSVWVPPNQSRRTSARPLRKYEVKQFNLVCTCLRRTEKGACEAPLKP